MNAIRWSAALLAAGLTMTGVLAAAPAGQAAQASESRLARFYAQHVR